MIALLKSDLYRTARSRWPWVVLAIIAFAQLGSAVLTAWHPLPADLVYDGLTGPSGALRLGGCGSSVGIVALVAPFVAAHLSCADSDTGFDRTLLSSLAGRAAYFAEKYLLVVILSGGLLLAYLVLSGIGAFMTARPVTGVEPVWQLVAWAGASWLVSCAYALIVLLAGQLTRSRALAFSVAFLLITAAVEQGFFTFLLLVSNALVLDWGAALEAAFAWMPYVARAAVEGGAAELLATDATGVAPALRALAVCVPLCLGATALGALAGSRRDVG